MAERFLKRLVIEQSMKLNSSTSQIEKLCNIDSSFRTITNRSGGTVVFRRPNFYIDLTLYYSTRFMLLGEVVM
ncbi:hypothetical protein GT50_07315 [Geobacillus stearothermophilus 10]|nr:hypothetical protein GT50_07315 [Geobacillus stearothermophilus 10]